MIILHHLEQSRSHRFLWLMEELGVKYEIKHYKRDAKTKLAPPELKAVHPLGKSPVISDGDLVIAESGAIIEYLIERYGNGHMMPKPGSDDHLRYRYWLHYGEGTLMPLMVMSLIFGQVEKAPLFVRPIAKAISGQVKKAYLGPNIQANLDFVESELGKSTWLAGEELTGADIMLSFPLEAAGVRGGRDTARPNIQAFIERIHARPAWTRAVERGGPLEFIG